MRGVSCSSSLKIPQAQYVDTLLRINQAWMKRVPFQTIALGFTVRFLQYCPIF